MSIGEEVILVVDFGSQYAHLIARRIRELKVYSEIVFPDITEKEIEKIAPKGIIFSGGPRSVYEKDAPLLTDEVFDYLIRKYIPILGICYCHQLIALKMGGNVKGEKKKEYGIATVDILDQEGIFKDLENKETVWMSHGDQVFKLPPDFTITSKTDNSPIAAFRSTSKKIYGLQWHPEVVHTKNGQKILSNFVYDVCGCKGTWDLSDFIEENVIKIRNKIGSGKAVIALSGGVDSSVAAAVAEKAIGNRLYAVFVDHGLLRKGEAEVVSNAFSGHDINFKKIDAKKRFFDKLEGVTDPEKKRMIIGEEFIRIFEEEAKKIGADFLVQGTIYPDIIESGRSQHADTIKSHHNVGGLPDSISFKEIIEPLRDLYKDEVREVGRRLGLPDKIIDQYPFPGPGLAVRITGPVTEENIRICREASSIVEEELEKASIENIWQAFAVTLGDRVVGVVGDQRKFGRIVALRIVESQDAMTANFKKLPWDVLEKISTRITNEVPEVVSVAYFISHKPPQTIEPC
ncbi:MAG: glutamine-hydrolyzing GMP synthase [Candidatus Methanofastidiosa archaeon]|nr:glutamine-hydrolyzing GMP synthase [Candidatus Methanofastidiosa archaeon]